MGELVNLATVSSQDLSLLEEEIRAERVRRIREAEQFQAENTASRMYHEQMPSEKVDGFPVWVQPLAPIMGYWSGAIVHHSEELWMNDLDRVNMEEPGTEDSGWSPAGGVAVGEV